MHFFYLDESGNSGANLLDADQPIHFISGIGIQAENMGSIEKALKLLLPDFMPYSSNYDFEFHGVTVFQGKDYFKHFKLETRLNLFERLVTIAEENEVTFFSQGINKKRHREKYKNPYLPHSVAFMYLVEKLEAYLKKKGSCGLIIMDKCEDTEQNIINSFRLYKEIGTTYGFFKGEIEHFFDNVLYVKSYNSPFVQLSDMLGYIHSSTKVDALKKVSSTYHKKFIYELDERIKKISVYDCIDPQ